MKKTLIGGGFDIIHSGHIFRINQARCFGDYLIVNITPDNRIKNKGEDRPVFSQKERMLIVGNIKGVDEVVCVPSSEENHWEYEIKQLKEVKPDVFITEKRGNIDDKFLTDFCEDNKIELYFLQDLKGITGFHTTDIIAKIKGVLGHY